MTDRAHFRPFETDLDEDLLNITASSVHFSKTLMNLVANAAEALLIYCRYQSTANDKA